MPRTRAVDPAPTTILDAAERLFAERGFRATTIQELGKASGLSPALIYYYYHDKAGLYRAVISRIVHTLAERGLARLGASTDPADGVRAIVEVQAGYMLEHPHLARLMARELVNEGGATARSAMRDSLAHLFARLRDLIALGQRTGRFRPDLDPAYAAVSTIAQVAWFAVASPVVGPLLAPASAGVTGSAKRPLKAHRQQFAAHAAAFALSALERDRSSGARR